VPSLILPGDLDLPALFAPAAAAGTNGLAVSGGPDSLALLFLAQRWAHERGGPRLIVYTVDHGLRTEAAEEVRFVCGVAASLGLAARVLRWDGAKPTSGVQAAARAARYRLMGAAMRADGAELLLTAHHRDDQAETVLMRLAHGSGLEGLRGMDQMSEVEGVRVFRPLLPVPRAKLAAIVAGAGLTPVTDPGNADPHYERARWRAALPQLAGLGLDADALGTLARRAGEADAALTFWAEREWAHLVSVDALGAACVSAAALTALPKALGIKLLGRLVEAAGGGRRPHVLGAIERLHAALAADAPFAG
jgi:tRNA(Ile)-lysidine synthase